MGNVDDSRPALQRPDDLDQSAGNDLERVGPGPGTGQQSPCACVLDGIAIAVSASPGQRTLTLEPDRTPPGLLGQVSITHRKSGRKLTYRLPQSALPLMQAINRDEKDVGRFEAVMKMNAGLLYRVE